MERKLLDNFEILKHTTHYYAKYCPLGNCTYDSFGGTCWKFFCFGSKAERDAWVEKNQYDKSGNVVAWATTRKTVEHVKGKKFVMVDGVCWRDEYEYFDELERTAAIS